MDFPLHYTSQLGLTKRQAIRECKAVADELIYRMERAARYPGVKNWAMDSETNKALSNRGFALSIVYGAR